MDHPRDAGASVPFCQSSTREYKPGGGFSHVKPPTEWQRQWSELRETVRTVTKKLPYPALGRVATGDRSHSHERGLGSSGETSPRQAPPLPHYLPPCHPHQRDARQKTAKGPASIKRRGPQCRWISSESNLRKSQRSIHLMILVTRPEPTVRPPSRMAKPRPGSIAMGWISSTEISVVSPGMTMSVPSGRVMTPVTSVVRK